MTLKNWAYLLCLGLLVSNCNKEEAGLFDVPMQVEFTIPAGLNSITAHYIEIENISSPLAGLISQRGLTVEDIKSINPKSAEIVSLFDNQEYGFLRNISVEIFPAGGDSRLSRELYYRDPVPQNAGDNLGLVATLIDAKEELVEERFSLRIRMEVLAPPQQFIESRLNLEFVVR